MQRINKTCNWNRLKRDAAAFDPDKPSEIDEGAAQHSELFDIPPRGPSEQSYF